MDEYAPLTDLMTELDKTVEKCNNLVAQRVDDIVIKITNDVKTSMGVPMDVQLNASWYNWRTHEVETPIYATLRIETQNRNVQLKFRVSYLGDPSSDTAIVFLTALMNDQASWVMDYARPEVVIQNADGLREFLKEVQFRSRRR